jgi:hypothetical protein
MAKKKQPEQPVSKRDSKAMIDKIRGVIAEYAGDISERECYEALVNEASGWKMRLEEIEEENAEEDE